MDHPFSLNVGHINDLTGLWNNLKLALLSTEKSSLATMFSSTHNVIMRTSK